MKANCLKRCTYGGVIACGIVLLLQLSVYFSTSSISDLVLKLRNHQLTKSLNYTELEISSTHDDKVAKSVGYILSVTYRGQMMAGFRGFCRLASLTALLNLSIVEPYVQDIGLQGAPTVTNRKPDPEAVALGCFYDLNDLKKALKKCTNNTLVTFQHFATTASRNIVLLTFVTSLESLGHYFSAGNHRYKIVEIERMTSSQQQGLKTLNSWVSYVRDKEGLQLPLSSFTMSRVILVDARPLHPLPMSDLMGKLHSVIHEEVARFGSTTVLLDDWRDIQLRYPSGFSYSLEGFKYKYCNDIDTVKHSESILSQADEFIQSLKHFHPVVGIHLRAERLLLDFDARMSHLTDCLTQLQQLLTNGTIANISHGSVYLFHDMGQYGSRTCNLKEWAYCKKGGKEFLNKVKKQFGKIIISFDPSSFYPVSLQGQIAAFVEREYLSRVDVLVTVARGGYQDSIVKRFLKNRSWKRHNLHRICNNPPPPPQCYPKC